MDNQSLARVFDEIAAVLELKNENPFRVRAYRTAADLIATSTARIVDLPTAELLRMRGIGRDLAAKIRELAETGRCEYHVALLAEYPPTLLELARLPGVGPKTTALLYRELKIASVGDLEAAAREGRLRQVRGFGARREEALLQALQERRQHGVRHLLPKAAAAAATVVEFLREQGAAESVEVVGSLRRRCETIGDLDILATAPDAALMEPFIQAPGVERVLGRGETKSSILLRGGFQVDLRIVPAASRGAALQYFTGSKAHNIALRDRALQRGLRLNEYELARLEDGHRVAGSDEPGLYEALGLDYVPPELREDRGELAAAASGALPRLIERRHLRGDLHAHTTATDGRDSIEAMALAARAAGLEYLAITDHTQSLAMANGMNEARTLEHAAAVREVSRGLDGIELLAGVECDIRPDGTLDLADECLAELDLVVASVHSRFSQDEAEMTDRIARALQSPYVDVVGHPTGRLLLRREPYRVDVGRIVAEAARLGVALEINCQIDRLDLNEWHAAAARARGAKLVIGSDAHSVRGFDVLQWGVAIARRAWVEPAHVLNTLRLTDLRSALRGGRRKRR